MLAISIFAFVGLAVLADAFTGPDDETSDGDPIEDRGDGAASDPDANGQGDLLDPPPTDGTDPDDADAEVGGAPDDGGRTEDDVPLHDADRTVSTRPTGQPMVIGDLAGSSDGDLSGTRNPDGSRTIDQVYFVDDEGDAHPADTVLGSIAIRDASDDAAEILWDGAHVLTIQGFSADDLVHQTIWIGNFSDAAP